MYVQLCKEGFIYDSLKLNPNVVYCNCSFQVSISKREELGVKNIINEDLTMKLLFTCISLLTKLPISYTSLWIQ